MPGEDQDIIRDLSLGNFDQPLYDISGGFVNPVDDLGPINSDDTLPGDTIDYNLPASTQSYDIDEAQEIERDLEEHRKGRRTSAVSLDKGTFGFGQGGFAEKIGDTVYGWFVDDAKEKQRKEQMDHNISISNIYDKKTEGIDQQKIIDASKDRNDIYKNIEKARNRGDKGEEQRLINEYVGIANRYNQETGRIFDQDFNTVIDAEEYVIQQQEYQRVRLERNIRENLDDYNIGDAQIKEINKLKVDENGKKIYYPYTYYLKKRKADISYRDKETQGELIRLNRKHSVELEQIKLQDKIKAGLIEESLKKKAELVGLQKESIGILGADRGIEETHFLNINQQYYDKVIDTIRSTTFDDDHSSKLNTIIQTVLNTFSDNDKKILLNSDYLKKGLSADVAWKESNYFPYMYLKLLGQPAEVLDDITFGVGASAGVGAGVGAMVGPVGAGIGGLVGGGAGVIGGLVNGFTNEDREINSLTNQLMSGAREGFGHVTGIFKDLWYNPEDLVPDLLLGGGIAKGIQYGGKALGIAAGFVNTGVTGAILKSKRAVEITNRLKNIKRIKDIGNIVGSIGSSKTTQLLTKASQIAGAGALEAYLGSGAAMDAVMNQTATTQQVRDNMVMDAFFGLGFHGVGNILGQGVNAGWMSYITRGLTPDDIRKFKDSLIAVGIEPAEYFAKRDNLGNIKKLATLKEQDKSIKEFIGKTKRVFDKRFGRIIVTDDLVNRMKLMSDYKMNQLYDVGGIGFNLENLLFGNQVILERMMKTPIEGKEASFQTMKDMLVDSLSDINYHENKKGRKADKDILGFTGNYIKNIMDNATDSVKLFKIYNNFKNEYRALLKKKNKSVDEKIKIMDFDKGIEYSISVEDFNGIETENGKISILDLNENNNAVINKKKFISQLKEEKKLIDKKVVQGKIDKEVASIEKENLDKLAAEHITRLKEVFKEAYNKKGLYTVGPSYQKIFDILVRNKEKLKQELKDTIRKKLGLDENAEDKELTKALRTKLEDMSIKYSTIDMKDLTTEKKQAQDKLLTEIGSILGVSKKNVGNTLRKYTDAPIVGKKPKDGKKPKVVKQFDIDSLINNQYFVLKNSILDLVGIQTKPEIKALGKTTRTYWIDDEYKMELFKRIFGDDLQISVMKGEGEKITESDMERAYQSNNDMVLLNMEDGSTILVGGGNTKNILGYDISNIYGDTEVPNNFTSFNKVMKDIMIMGNGNFKQSLEDLRIMRAQYNNNTFFLDDGSLDYLKLNGYIDKFLKGHQIQMEENTKKFLYSFIDNSDASTKQYMTLYVGNFLNYYKNSKRNIDEYIEDIVINGAEVYQYNEISNMFMSTNVLTNAGLVADLNDSFISKMLGSQKVQINLYIKKLERILSDVNIRNRDLYEKILGEQRKYLRSLENMDTEGLVRLLDNNNNDATRDSILSGLNRLTFDMMYKKPYNRFLDNMLLTALTHDYVHGNSKTMRLYLLISGAVENADTSNKIFNSDIGKQLREDLSTGSFKSIKTNKDGNIVIKKTVLEEDEMITKSFTYNFDALTNNYNTLTTNQKDTLFKDAKDKAAEARQDYRYVIEDKMDQLKGGNLLDTIQKRYQNLSMNLGHGKNNTINAEQIEILKQKIAGYEYTEVLLKDNVALETYIKNLFKKGFRSQNKTMLNNFITKFGISEEQKKIINDNPEVGFKDIYHGNDSLGIERNNIFIEFIDDLIDAKKYENILGKRKVDTKKLDKIKGEKLNKIKELFDGVDLYKGLDADRNKVYINIIDFLKENESMSDVFDNELANILGNIKLIKESISIDTLGGTITPSSTLGQYDINIGVKKQFIDTKESDKIIMESDAYKNGDIKQLYIPQNDFRDILKGLSDYEPEFIQGKKKGAPATIGGGRINAPGLLSSAENKLQWIGSKNKIKPNILGPLYYKLLLQIYNGEITAKGKTTTKDTTTASVQKIIDKFINNKTKEVDWNKLAKEKDTALKQGFPENDGDFYAKIIQAESKDKGKGFYELKKEIFKDYFGKIKDKTNPIDDWKPLFLHGSGGDIIYFIKKDIAEYKNEIVKVISKEDNIFTESEREAIINSYNKKDIFEKVIEDILDDKKLGDKEKALKIAEKNINYGVIDINLLIKIQKFQEDTGERIFNDSDQVEILSRIKREQEALQEQIGEDTARKQMEDTYTSSEEDIKDMGDIPEGLPSKVEPQEVDKEALKIEKQEVDIKKQEVDKEKQEVDKKASKIEEKKLGDFYESEVFNQMESTYLFNKHLDLDAWNFKGADGKKKNRNGKTLTMEDFIKRAESSAGVRLFNNIDKEYTVYVMPEKMNMEFEDIQSSFKDIDNKNVLLDKLQEAKQNTNNPDIIYNIDNAIDFVENSSLAWEELKADFERQYIKDYADGAMYIPFNLLRLDTSINFTKSQKDGLFKAHIFSNKGIFFKGQQQGAEIMVNGKVVSDAIVASDGSYKMGEILDKKLITITVNGEEVQVYKLKQKVSTQDFYEASSSKRESRDVYKGKSLLYKLNNTQYNKMMDLLTTEGVEGINKFLDGLQSQGYNINAYRREIDKAINDLSGNYSSVTLQDAIKEKIKQVHTLIFKGGEFDGVSGKLLGVDLHVRDGEIYISKKSDMYKTIYKKTRKEFENNPDRYPEYHELIPEDKEKFIEDNLFFYGNRFPIEAVTNTSIFRIRTFESDSYFNKYQSKKGIVMSPKDGERSEGADFDGDTLYGLDIIDTGGEIFSRNLYDKVVSLNLIEEGLRIKDGESMFEYLVKGGKDVYKNPYVAVDPEGFEKNPLSRGFNKIANDSITAKTEIENFKAFVKNIRAFLIHKGDGQVNINDDFYVYATNVTQLLLDYMKKNSKLPSDRYIKLIEFLQDSLPDNHVFKTTNTEQLLYDIKNFQLMYSSGNAMKDVPKKLKDLEEQEINILNSKGIRGSVKQLYDLWERLPDKEGYNNFKNFYNQVSTILNTENDTNLGASIDGLFKPDYTTNILEDILGQTELKIPKEKLRIYIKVLNLNINLKALNVEDDIDIDSLDITLDQRGNIAMLKTYEDLNLGKISKDTEITTIFKDVIKYKSYEELKNRGTKDKVIEQIELASKDKDGKISNRKIIDNIEDLSLLEPRRDVYITNKEGFIIGTSSGIGIRNIDDFKFAETLQKLAESTEGKEGDELASIRKKYYDLIIKRYENIYSFKGQMIETDEVFQKALDLLKDNKQKEALQELKKIPEIESYIKLFDSVSKGNNKNVLGFYSINTNYTKNILYEMSIGNFDTYREFMDNIPKVHRKEYALIFAMGLIKHYPRAMRIGEVLVRMEGEYGLSILNSITESINNDVVRQIQMNDQSQLMLIVESIKRSDVGDKATADRLGKIFSELTEGNITYERIPEIKKELQDILKESEKSGKPMVICI